MDKNTLHKEIDLIQGCINRMAHNSFMLKGWTVSLIAVVLALMKDEIDFIALSLILLIPIICFWYLDAFFLRTERMYRKLYEWVIKERLNDNNEFLYDLNSSRFKKEVQSTLGVMFSPTLKVFYGVIAFADVVLLVNQLTIKVCFFINQYRIV